MTLVVESEITALLRAHRRGEAGSLERLMPHLYGGLRRLARRQLRRLRPGDTLDTTALVHEAYLKMVAGDASWRERAHFLAAAAQAMRHVLVDAARQRAADKRGGGRLPITLKEGALATRHHALDVLAVEQALGRLRELDERMCRVVECRFFAGMTEEETGEALGVSWRTVHRDWLRARGWLRVQLGREPAAGGDDG